MAANILTGSALVAMLAAIGAVAESLRGHARIYSSILAAVPYAADAMLYLPPALHIRPAGHADLCSGDYHLYLYQRAYRATS